jgi:methionine-rich copper-binding protein CopC
MRTARAGLGAILLFLLLPAVVLAHAQLLSSTPAPDEVLATLPPAIVLTFDDELTSVSSFLVVDASGSTVAQGAVNPANPKSMTAAMPALSDGAYHLRWTAGTTDGHIERAEFAFSVALATPPPGTSAAASQAATAAPAATPAQTSAGATPAPTGATAGSDSGSGGDVVLAIVAAGVLVAGGLVFFVRRRGA